MSRVLNSRWREAAYCDLAVRSWQKGSGGRTGAVANMSERAELRSGNREETLKLDSQKLQTSFRTEKILFVTFLIRLNSGQT